MIEDLSDQRNTIAKMAMKHPGVDLTSKEMYQSTMTQLRSISTLINDIKSRHQKEDDKFKGQQHCFMILEILEL